MKIFNSISATALVTALGMAWSSQAYSDLYTIHKVSNFTVKFDRQVGDSANKEKIRKKDTLEFLLNGESSNKRILVAIVDCNFEVPDDIDFDFGVWDKDTEELVETVLLEWDIEDYVGENTGDKAKGTIHVDNEDDSNPDEWAGLFDNFFQDLEFQGKIVFRDLKDKLIPSGFEGNTTCVHTIKAFSNRMGDSGDSDDFDTTDNVVTGGNVKIGKPIAAVEMFD